MMIYKDKQKSAIYIRMPDNSHENLCDTICCNPVYHTFQIYMGVKSFWTPLKFDTMPIII